MIIFEVMIMPKGITLLLSGGLGNQLFQYASIRAQAIRLNLPLTVDLRFYRGDEGGMTKKPWLVEFPIRSKVRSYSSGVFGAHALHRRILRRLVTERPSKTYHSKLIGRDNTIIELSDGLVVSGLFQSPDHFSEKWHDIASELDLPGLGLLDVPTVVDGRDLSRCIGIHVRRADYLTQKGFEMRDPVEYYRRGLEVLRGGSHSDIVVFTDDPQWCQRQEVFSGAKYFYGADTPPYIDLFTMSRCGKLLIANSTFSWWAAWFASRRDAQIVAPKEWIFGSGSKELGMMPAEWILM